MNTKRRIIKRGMFMNHYNWRQREKVIELCSHLRWCGIKPYKMMARMKNLMAVIGLDTDSKEENVTTIIYWRINRRSRCESMRIRFLKKKIYREQK